MENDMSYRPNVGIMLINNNNKIWMGNISLSKGGDFPWQMPQGGIEAGESPVQAALREIYEETGLTPDKVQILAESKDWHCYDFPPEIAQAKHIKGQRQKWVLMRFMGTENDFNLSIEAKPEFSSYQWMDPQAIGDKVIPWKRAVYEAVMTEFSTLFNK